MRVVHIISGISKASGGPARSSQGLVAALNHCGVEAWLLSCTPGETPWVDGVTNFRAPPSGGLGALRRFFHDAFSELKPDLIHLHCIWSPALHIAAVEARRMKIPYIIAPRGMLEPWSLQQKKWKKRLALALYQGRDLRLACALHATAESEADNLRALGCKNRIVISPNGIAPMELPPKMHPDDRLRVLFLSRMHPKKGVLELVEAWGKVRPKAACCELVYTMASETEREYEQKVKARVKELGREADFIFTGPMPGDEKWAAYRRADLFVLPTYSENFGIVIAEALYAGLPVITTKGTPWQELETHQCGKWIETGVEPLVITLKKMMQLSREQLQEMGDRGRKLVEQNYLWSAISKNMCAAYEEILSDADSKN